jgi:hypothetical protein
LQLRYLRDERAISPESIVLIVDQTDLGDEACRYASRIIEDAKGRLLRVEPETTDSDEVYDHSRDLTTYSIVSRDDLSPISKILRWYQAKLTNKTMRLLRSAEMRCGWSAISKQLVKSGERAQSSFSRALTGYVEEALGSMETRCLLIVTHPHRAHLEPREDEALYETDVSELVGAALNEHFSGDRVYHLDVRPEFSRLYEELSIDEVFDAADVASHLTSTGQRKYAERIISELRSRCGDKFSAPWTGEGRVRPGATMHDDESGGHS